MDTISESEYQNIHWPMLRDAVDKLIDGPGQEGGPTVNFERVFTTAYKLVCQQHSKMLYNDLIHHFSQHLKDTEEHLKKFDESEIINACYHVVHRVLYSIDGIVPIFMYLNRIYVVQKFGIGLRDVLQNLFCAIVLDPHIERLLLIMKLSSEIKPFSIPPHVKASIIKALYKLKPAYSSINAQLFSTYIPGVEPSMTIADLPNYISATQDYQNNLRKTWTLTSSGRKRSFEDNSLT